MLRVVVTALKDEARVLGLILHKGNTVELDIMESQKPAIQAAVDSGDVACDGYKPMMAEKPAEKAPEKVAKK